MYGGRELARNADGRFDLSDLEGQVELTVLLQRK
jgi:hypothetical protein